jgi:hypothetical protein
MRKFLMLAAVAVLMPLGCSSGPQDLPPEVIQVGDMHSKDVEQELRVKERERQREAVEGKPAEEERSPTE